MNVSKIALGLALLGLCASAQAAVTTKTSPSTASVRLGDSATFTASNIPAGPTPTWKVVSTATTSTGPLGTVDQTGKYVAPTSLPTPNTVLVELVDSKNAVIASSTVTLLNPIPVISLLSPATANVGLPYKVTMTGTGFLPTSQVQMAGKPWDTSKYQIRSSTEIDLIDTPTTAGGVSVTVVNPDPGTRTSSGKTLNVQNAVSVKLTPDKQTIRGGATLQLHPTVEYNTDQRVTWLVNATPNGNSTLGTITLDANSNPIYTAPATIPGASVTVTATSVVDPRASATITINLYNPLPVISSVSPNPLPIGATSFTITGTGFAPGGTILVDGLAFTTTVKSDKSISASGTLSPVPGRTLALKVSNPAPGAATSAPTLVQQLVCNPCKMAYSDAVRFLEMASWGPTPASIAHLQQIGRDAWLAEQFAMPTTAWPLANSLTEGASRIQQDFFTRALTGDDQLRQRVAFALSEIFVVSGVKDNRYEAMRSYMQALSDDAFGSYRNLLEVMTLNPAMGWYLDMVNNDEANPAKNTVANENYAREVMQLFSIGLSKLNQDGTPVSPTVSTYDASVVTEMARVFTGWTYPPIPDTQSHWTNQQYFAGQMVAFPEHHDPYSKSVVFPGYKTCSFPGGSAPSSTSGKAVTAPPPGDPTGDLKIALDCLSGHPNVAPFISYRLIQRLVKSSPTPGYVSKVAAAFGTGTGDLKAAVTAILTDREATDQPTTMDAGKLREPVLYATNVLRALDASVLNSTASGITSQTKAMGEDVLYSGSVFNYFSPFYRIPGFGVVAPEFQTFNSSTGLSRMNFAYRAVNNQLSSNIRVDYTKWQDLASLTDPSALVEAANQALYHGNMPSAVRDSLIAIAKETTDINTRLKKVLYYAAGAPDYQVEQ